jgi:ABC-2 type transport system permease protein
MRFITQKNRAILREMVVTDFKVRYQGSILGYAWSVLRPLFLFIILYIVFVKFLRIGGEIPNFPVYLLMGIVLWGFFTEATSTTMTSIVNQGDLMRKISIPRYLVVVSAAFSAFISLGLNLLILLVIAFLNGLRPMESWLLVPIFILELFIFAIALGFFLSALFVKFRDASYVWEVLLQAGFYATPILYPISIVAEKYQRLLMLNPMAQIVQDSRWAFVSHQTLSSWKVLDIPLMLVPFLFISFMVVVSTIYFKKESKYFAERI